MLPQIHGCGGRGLFRLLPSATLYNLTSTRKVVDLIQAIKDDSTKPNVKRALFSAKRKQRITLPYYEGACENMYHISHFLNHPTGVEAMLNVNALENYVSLDASTYRCRLPPIQLLNFEVSPVLDLQVNPTTGGCMVELLSCKFEGSEILENQNKYFSASMKNFITWGESGSESFLDVDVKLNISLEIYDRPFTLLPVSAVEGPGNLVMQALLDRYVPLLLQQLLRDYDSWVQKQRRNLP